MGSTFVSDDFMKSRRPQSLASTNDIPEIVAPDETDYRAYFYYKLILKTALDYVKNKKNFMGSK